MQYAMIDYETKEGMLKELRQRQAEIEAAIMRFEAESEIDPRWLDAASPDF
jgi:hypothetical protein